MTQEFTLEHLLHELAAERGIDFRDYKRPTLERRIRKRMLEVKAQGYKDYAAYLRSYPDEVNQLVNTVLINVTEFFRDPAAWETLRREALPKLLMGRQPGDSIRCWSAGCGSGEEPYSIAILLAEHFGARLPEYDIKIYATDIDEEALRVARRAEYSLDHVQHLRAEWRKKYFKGGKSLRVRSDLRRLCIFGRSNLLYDAPISHVDLLVCRNVLIYFAAGKQAEILTRFRYALEPNGVLFIGKASSLLSSGHLFQPINSRFRIFQRADAPVGHEITGPAVAGEGRPPAADDRDVEFLRLRHAKLLETLEAGVLVLDAKGTVLTENPSATRLWGIKSPLSGKAVGDTELGTLCPELAIHLELTRRGNEDLSFQCKGGSGSKAHTLSVTLKPVISPAGGRVGTLVYMEDISPREKLKVTIEQLEATGQELQSANQELETANEELQSANEELETTNEELQSTNEELETTNEELQSLNEELQTANEELATRGKEMDELNTRYIETLERIPWPVMVVGPKLRIEFWNSLAQKLFGFHAPPAADLRLEQLPVSQAFRKRLIRRHRASLSRKLRSVLRDEVLDGRTTVNVHFTPLAINGAPQNVLIMFDPTGSSLPELGKSRNAGSKQRASHSGRRKNGARNRGRSRRS